MVIRRPQAGSAGPTGSRGHVQIAMVVPARMLMSYTETEARFRRREAAGGNSNVHQRISDI